MIRPFILPDYRWRWMMFRRDLLGFDNHVEPSIAPLVAVCLLMEFICDMDAREDK